MAADPTVSIYGARGLTGNGDVGTDDIATDAVTAAKLADDAVTGDTIANLGVDAGKLNLGAVSTALAIASAVVNEYHRTNTTNSVSASRDIAYTDVGDVIACAGPITLTVPLDMTSSGSTGWRLGQFCFVECANASTVTLAAAGGVTLTAPSGLVLDGAGSVGILLRVGTNSWRFHTLAGNTWLPVAAIDATGTAGDATYLRGDGSWAGSVILEKTGTERFGIVPNNGDQGDLTGYEVLLNSDALLWPLDDVGVKPNGTGSLVVVDYAGFQAPIQASGVTAQGDVEVTDSTSGLILTSPDSSRWRVTVGNDGSLTTTEIV